MKINVQVFEGSCGVVAFTIGGQDADVSDFGRWEDTEPWNAPDYGCGNRQFVPKWPHKGILARYGITKNGYVEVCVALRKALAWGRCSLCE